MVARYMCVLKKAFESSLSSLPLIRKELNTKNREYKWREKERKEKVTVEAMDFCRLDTAIATASTFQGIRCGRHAGTG